MQSFYILQPAILASFFEFSFTGICVRLFCFSPYLQLLKQTTLHVAPQHTHFSLSLSVVGLQQLCMISRCGS